MTNQSTHGVRMRGVARTRARAPGCGGGGRGAPERAAPQAGLTGLRGYGGRCTVGDGSQGNYLRTHTRRAALNKRARGRGLARVCALSTS